MEPYDLVCFGEVLYDVYESKRVLAGAPMNVASFAAFLGLKTGLISAVGKKKSDDEIEEELIQRNVVPFLERRNIETGEARIRLNKNKVPEFHISMDSAYDHIRKTETLVNLVENAEFFNFGTLAQRNEDSRNTLMDLLSEVDVTTVYDVNLRKGIPLWESIVANSLKFASVLKMNEAESAAVRGAVCCRNIEQLFDKTSLDYVFVTLGEKGAQLYQKNGDTLFVEAPKVNAVDTTGCGDSFTAALIYGFHEHWSNQKILEFAVGFASKVAQYEGAFNFKFLTQKLED